MKTKLWIPIIFILAVLGFGFYNVMSMGGFSPYETQLLKSQQLLLEKDYNGSKAILEKLIKRYPDSVDIPNLIADIYEKQAQWEEAHHWYETALAIEADNPEAILGLLSLDQKQENFLQLQALFSLHKQADFIQSNKPMIPQPTVANGEYSYPFTLFFATDPSTLIFYTVDGSEPTLESLRYDGGILLEPGYHIIKAIALTDGLISDVSESIFNIKGENGVVTFQSNQMERAIRAYLKKEEAPITSKDLEAITSLLVLGNQVYVGIEDSQLVYSQSEGNYTLKYISVFRNGTQVDYTYVPKDDFDGFQDLKLLYNLKLLHVYNQTTFDFNYITQLYHLERLSVSYIEKLIQPEMLSAMGNLKELYLLNDNIADISFLKGLTALQTLDLSFNQIQEVTPLSALSWLSSLTLVDNQITDIQSLYSNQTLAQLHLDSNHITNIEGIGSLSQLKTLSLSYNQIKNFVPTKELKNVENLNIEHNTTAPEKESSLQKQP